MNAVISLLLGLLANNAVLSQPIGGYPQPPVQQQGLIPPQGPVYGQPPLPVQQPGFGYQPQPPMYPQPGFGAQGFGAFGGAFMDPQQLNCEFPGQCRNRRITLTPSHDFQLNCQQPGGCDGLDLTLNVGNDPLNFGSGVSQIESLNFDAPTRGATIRINTIPGQNVEVNHIRCNQIASCNGLNVIAGFGVEIWNIQVECQMGACVNCKVNGMDCNMLSFQHGNNNNMAFGYYNNQPYGNYGTYPQQPGFGRQPASPYGGGYSTQPRPQPQPQYRPQQPQYGAPRQPPAPPAIAPPVIPQGPPAPPAQSSPQTNPGGQGQGPPSNPNTQLVPPIPPVSPPQIV